MGGRNKDFFTRQMFFGQFPPALFSAAGLAIGNMADAVVVGRRMGVTGLAAISLALPVFMMVNVLMLGFGIGGSIRFSTRLADGERTEAFDGFRAVFWSALVIGVLLAVAGNIFLVPVLALCGTTAKDGLLFQVSCSYVRIIISGIPAFLISYIFNYYLRNDDCQKLAGIGFTVGNLSDFVFNIVLVLMLDMGAAGAAWATVLGQLISIGFYLTAFVGKKKVLAVFPVKIHMREAFSCFCLGFSSSVQYLFDLVFLLLANRILMSQSGSPSVAVLDMIQNASFLVLLFYDGASKAVQPLFSTYYGEHNREGQHSALFLGICWGVLPGMAALLLVAAFPGLICVIFGLEETSVLKLGSYALRIYCLAIPLSGIRLLLESYGQACGKDRAVFWWTVLRGAVIRLPLTVLFVSFGNQGFWFLFFFTELISLFLFCVYCKSAVGKQRDFDQNRVYTRMIQNKNEDLACLTEEIEAFCEHWNAAAKQQYFVIMTVEELCSAIMKKAFNRQEGYIQVTLAAEENGEFSLHIRDNAVSFNPFSLYTEKAGANQDYDMDAMGMLVIKQKAKDFFYRHYQGFNTLVVKI